MIPLSGRIHAPWTYDPEYDHRCPVSRASTSSISNDRAAKGPKGGSSKTYHCVDLSGSEGGTLDTLTIWKLDQPICSLSRAVLLWSSSTSSWPLGTIRKSLICSQPTTFVSKVCSCLTKTTTWRLVRGRRWRPRACAVKKATAHLPATLGRGYGVQHYDP